MIAREIIAYTQMLPLDATDSELERAQSLMSEIADVITSEELQNDWRDANDHLQVIITEQCEKSGEHNKRGTISLRGHDVCFNCGGN